MKAVIGAVVGGGFGAATGEDEKPQNQQLFDFQAPPQNGQQQPVAKPKTKGDRILTGAAVGLTIGAGIDLVQNVNIKENAESGAIQNDPQRRDWEWQRQINEEREERERQARAREEQDRERDGRGW